MTQHDTSYGIIPVLKKEGDTIFLLIHMYGSGGGTHWTFPKGRPEPGETPLTTALRETKEEVGIEPVEVLKKQPFTYSYSFTSKNGVIIEKQVTYFVGYVADERYTLQADEVKEAIWLTASEALERLTYDNNKELFKKVAVYLEDS